MAAELLGPGQVRSRSYAVIRRTASDRFFKKIVFQPRNLLPLTWVEILCMFWSAHDHIWPLALHLDLSNVIRSHWPWLAHTYLPIVANLPVLGVSWGPETEYVANFLHRHIYSTSLRYPISIRAIDPVCPQAILPMRVTPFPSGCYASQIFHQ